MGDSDATEPNDYPPALDSEQVAELLRMNIDTVRRLSREGVILSHRVPGSRNFATSSTRCASGSGTFHPEVAALKDFETRVTR
jgi:hypothetical protein